MADSRHVSAVDALCVVGGRRCFTCTLPELADAAEPSAAADQRVCSHLQGRSAVRDGE